MAAIVISTQRSPDIGYNAVATLNSSRLALLSTNSNTAIHRIHIDRHGPLLCSYRHAHIHTHQIPIRHHRPSRLHGREYLAGRSETLVRHRHFTALANRVYGIRWQLLQVLLAPCVVYRIDALVHRYRSAMHSNSSYAALLSWMASIKHATATREWTCV